MDFIVEAPINGLSFGNVSYNILRQFWRKGVNVHLYPFANAFDVSVYDKGDKEFLDWLVNAANHSNANIKKHMPSLKLWHLTGSHQRCAPKQVLYSFYELNKPTEVEINLAKLQDKVFFSSSYAANQFKKLGVDAEAVPLAFDEDFYKTGKQYLDKEIVHFGLMGKFEKRKHTEKIIKLWLKKYGNNNKYQLSVCVTNTFLKPEEMNGLLKNCFEGKNYSNINIIPYLKTNSEVNELLNAIDIDLTGLSGAEGWNLPAFNASCLGKWSIVLNETSHKDWANKENSILIESNGQEPVYDNTFFKEGSLFNQGNIYTWDSDVVSQAMDTAVSKKGQLNIAGEELKNKFSYSRSADLLIKGIESVVK